MRMHASFASLVRKSSVCLFTVTAPVTVTVTVSVSVAVAGTALACKQRVPRGNPHSFALGACNFIGVKVAQCQVRQATADESSRRADVACRLASFKDGLSMRVYASVCTCVCVCVCVGQTELKNICAM